MNVLEVQTMGLVQTNLTDDEQIRFNEVKDFLHENQLIEKNSIYAAVKWMIVEACNMVAKQMETMQPEPKPTPEVEEPELETAMLHGKEIPVIEAKTAPVTSEVEPITKEEPKKVRSFVIGGIDFRPRG